VRRRRWLHDVDRALLDLHPYGSLPGVAPAPIQIFAYQLEPAIAIARDGAERVLIADGVGLGKTVQAGIILLELVRQDEACRALILAPAGLRAQWRMELTARLGLEATLADSRWLKSASVDRPAHVNPWSMPGIYVASHDLVKRPEILRPLEDVTWDAVVVDEAHAATSGTDRRAALHAIALRSRHVVLLTATPHDGNPQEHEALARIGQRHDRDEPLVVFRRARADVRQGTARRTRVLAVKPSRAERQMYDLLERYSRRLWHEATARHDDRARLVSIVLRKRALSSARSLLSSIERRLMLLTDTSRAWQLSLPLGPDPDEDPVMDEEPLADLGAPGLADAGAEREWLTRIATAARNATADERKLSRLLRFLTRAREPVIIFTEYRDTLKELARSAARAGHSVSVLHGGLEAAERASVQSAFNESGGILLATDAASEGLNLHHRCRLVVHFELPWNPSRLEQRAGRVDRVGQSRIVHELALVMEHTAERLVLAPLAKRLAAAAQTGRHAFSALSESAIAATVMAGEPLPYSSDGGSAASWEQPPSAASSELAAVEAARLEVQRLLARRSADQPGSSRRSIVAARIRTRRIPPGLYFLFDVAIKGEDGTTIHSEPRMIRVELNATVDRGAALSHAQLQDIIAALGSGLDAPLAEIACQHDAQSLKEIAALASAKSDRVRRRQEAIRAQLAGGRPLASQLLIQPGLFDRRWRRAAVKRQQAALTLDDSGKHHEEGMEGARSVSTSAGLLAALHVTHGT
jgi:superfamily II DNA or RNA helicase